MPRQLKYRTVLVSFILIPVAVLGLFIGVIAMVTYVQSHRQMVRYLGHETNVRIASEVSRFLSVPMLINTMNADSLASGRVAWNDEKMFESLFISRVKYTPTVTSVYFGNDRGGVVDAGREGPGGDSYVIVTDGFKAGTFRKYLIDAGGQRGAQISAIPHFDARTRPWYRAAAEAGKPTWTEPFMVFTGQDSAISAVQPVYSSAGTLVGVLSVDIFLSQLRGFLSDLQDEMSGTCFISDGKGDIIVSPDGDGLPGAVIVKALEAGRAFIGKGGEGEPSMAEFEGEIVENRERYIVHSRPLPEEIGLPWRVYSIYADSSIASFITLDLPGIVAGIVLSLVLVTAIAFFLASAFERPIGEMVEFARDLAKGEYKRAPKATFLHETETLRRSLLEMRHELSHSFDDLTKEIAAKHQANARVESLLAEKELILKEVHHRVKNNLSVIVSLLRLDEGAVSEGNAVAVLREASSRVQSMSLLYDKLFLSGDYVEADAADYVRNIVRELSAHYDPEGRVGIRWDAEPGMMPCRVLFMIGIIVNEAVTNAYKYAFPGAPGSIRIRLANSGARAEMSIADDGVGLPTSTGSTGRSKFGMKLIETLADQLGGDLSVDGQKGTRIRLWFPIDGK